eukprot:3929309-Amphidinium_carterae.1
MTPRREVAQRMRKMSDTRDRTEFQRETAESSPRTKMSHPPRGSEGGRREEDIDGESTRVQPPMSSAGSSSDGRAPLERDRVSMARTEEAGRGREYHQQQGNRPPWWPEDKDFYLGSKSRRPLWYNSQQWQVHSQRHESDETAAMERDWQEQIQQWLREGKDVDIIYSPRPWKDPTVLATSAAPPSWQEEDSVVVPIVSCNRKIIEFCCDKHSTLGKPTGYSRGCRVRRITEKVQKEDGGTPWRRLNDSKHGDDPEYRKLMRQHDKTFDALWDYFVQIGEHCLSAHGIVLQKDRVKSFLKYHHLMKVDFHGCAVGLKSKAGIPIKIFEAVDTGDELPSAIAYAKHLKTNAVLALANTNEPKDKRQTF